MEHKTSLILFTTLLFTATANALPNDFNTKAQQILTTHYQKFKEPEYFSGISLSVYIPNQDIKNFYIGQESHDNDSKKITANTLFQIGSITKSFTAVVLLQLDKEKKLSLSNTLNDWLPEYNKWSTVNIEQLLNMTSGLPNYSDTPLWNSQEYQQPDRVWTNKQLIAFVYPNNFNPPIKSGYFYSNTNYVLADLIVEKATQNIFSQELINRTIRLAKLNNTFYPIPNMEKSVTQRMAHGYNYNQYDNPALVGQDMANNNLSWAAAAGGIVSNSEDIVKWVKALFIENTLLDAKQKQKMMSLVSLTTGKPISKTSASDPHGFGLGIAEGFMKNKHLERYWFYEGQTLGFRAFYMYVPCNKIIISSIFNSATNLENDHAKDLLLNTYELILNQNPSLICK